MSNVNALLQQPYTHKKNKETSNYKDQGINNKLTVEKTSQTYEREFLSDISV